MSIARLHHVGRAQKDQGKCQRCGVELNKGDAYVWWTVGFRSQFKYKVCTKTECQPSESSRESSKYATILAAQESFSAQIENVDTRDEIIELVAEVASAVEEVRDEYQEALDAFENGNSQMEEFVEHYESQLSEIESWEPDEGDEPEVCDDHDGLEPDEADCLACNECINMRQAWLDAMREQAGDVVMNLESA